MKIPENEIELIIWFFQSFPEWEIKWATSSSFPDACLYNKITREMWNTEFEFYSSSFIEHEHNPELCDWIICWIDDFPIRTTFPIWELSTGKFPEYVMASKQDEIDIQQYIENTMNKRKERRNLKVTSNWRKIRPSLSDEQVEFIATNEPKDIVSALAQSGFEITPRTASNWHVYAARERGVTLKQD